MTIETKGGIKRLTDLVGGDNRWDVNITGGSIENIAINSYDMANGGSVQPTDRIPVERNGVGYYIEGSEIGGSGAVNIFYPEDFGAKADAVGAQDGVLNGFTLSSPSYAFKTEDIGKQVWYSDGQPRVIASVSAGVATMTTSSGVVNGMLWMMGTDDTVAIQAALDAAQAVANPSQSEGFVPNDQYMRSGGIVMLNAGKGYLISNTQAEYDSGKTSALIVRRRTTFTGSGLGEHRSALLFKPGSYGDMVGNLSPTSYSDFIIISNMSLYGYGDFSPNGRDGIHIHIPEGYFPAVDPYNRVVNVFVARTKRNGFYFRGKGELHVANCDSNNNSQHGFHFEASFDMKISDCNAGGNRYNGFRIDSTGASIFTGCKSYYSGAGGGSNDIDCSNWVLLGNQEGGLVTFGNCMAQESRGSSWYVASGNNVFTGCQGYDPARLDLAGGTLPSNMASWKLVGNSCRLNSFSDCVAGPSATIYQNPNWQPNCSSVYIDAVDGNGAGPQLNQGYIWTYRSTINTGGGAANGTQYSGTGGVKTGGGVSNGKNPNLFIDGVPCALALGAAPASGDLIEIVDVSDTSASASGTKKLVAYSDLGGGGGMAIGGSITSATAGSVLFAGTSGVLQQDNANLFWDNTNNVLGIGTATPNANAILDLSSTTKAFMPPRMNNAQMFSVPSATNGMVVFQTDDKTLYVYNGQWREVGLKYSAAKYFDAGQILFGEQGLNGTNEVTLKAPDALAADCVVTLPGVTSIINCSVGKQVYDQTITAGGTTGAQTINKPAGTVNFAAGASSLVVTNSIVTTSSTIYCSVRTNDTTAVIKNVVPAAGSFTIRLEANATAETSVGFFVIN